MDLLFQASCTNNQIHLLEMPNMEVLKTISGIKVSTSKSALLPFNSYSCQHMGSPVFCLTYICWLFNMLKPYGYIFFVYLPSYLLLPWTWLDKMCMDLIALMSLLLYQPKITAYSSTVCFRGRTITWEIYCIELSNRIDPNIVNLFRCKFVRGTLSLLMILRCNTFVPYCQC
jgi:hypothetical protein